MKIVKKNLLLCGLSVAFSAVMLTGVISLNVKAEDSITMANANISMEYGASARISEDNNNGLRYTMEMSATDYAGLKQTYGDGISFGILIAPADYEKDNTKGELTPATVFGVGGTKVYDWATYNAETGEWVYDTSSTKTRIINLSSKIMKADEDDAERYVLYGTIANLDKSNYTREFVGVGYVQYVEDGDTKYKFLDDNENTRSMAYVAQVYQTLDDSVVDPEEKKIVKDTYLTSEVLAEETFYTVRHMLSDGNGGYVEGDTEKIDGALIGGQTEDATAKEFADYTYEKTDAATTVYANGKTVVNAYYVNNRVKNFTEENGVWTAQGNIADSNWQSQYAYTSTNYSDTVVYSVKISAPNGLDKSAYSAVPHVGITLTDGSQIFGGTFDNDGRVLEGAYKAIQIGLTPYSLYSQCGTNARMNRNLDNSASHTADYTSADHAYGFVEGVTERTLKIALYNDMLYIYVDGVLAKSYSVTDYTNSVRYFNTQFAANSQYRFGIHATSIDHSVYPVSFVVEKELYGDEAKAEIESKSISCTTDDYTSTFNDSTANTAIVYSVTVNTLEDVEFGNVNANVGVAIMASNEFEVMTIGFGPNGISSTCNGGMYRRWDGSSFNTSSTVNKDYAFASTQGGILKGGKLTVVIYNDTLYVYAGAITEKFVMSKSILVGGGAVNLASFTAGSQWKVGIGATYISSDYITIIERNRLYGEEALDYIKTNYSADITVS